MPLPTPTEGEAEREFIDRCMSSDVMEDEYSDSAQRLAVCYSQWRRYREKDEDMAHESSRDELEGKALTHNSTLAENEPAWSKIDKSKLPRQAFADMGEEGKRSTWRYPHHWVRGDTMYLHKGGLQAALAAAHGARTGRRESDPKVLAHLNKHAEAIGLESASKSQVSGIADDIGDLDMVAVPRIPDKHARRSFSPSDAELLAKAKVGKRGDPGFIEGYAAVWNEVDLDKEVMRKGAFAKSIEERVAAGKVKLMVKHYAHGGDALEVIGTVTEMREDEHGLWFHAKLSSDELAQRIRVKVIEGHIDGCSIGFLPVRWDFMTLDDGSQVLEHLECKAYEVTLTVKPVMPLAVITGAKSIEAAPRVIAGALDMLNADLDADAPAEEAGRVLQEKLGGVESAEMLGKAAQTLAERIQVMLDAVEMPGDTSPASGADVHAMQQAVMERRRRLLASIANE